jgi:D-glycerate 3-kinase
MPSPELQHFLESHQLPTDYLEQADRHFQPVVSGCLKQLARKKPLVLGINGCQGSGKSTLAAYLQTVFESDYQLKIVNLSMDDFYLSQAARAENARLIHPLLATRGVPGTHDITLAIRTLQSLLAGHAVPLSRFNKAEDELYPESDWDRAPTEPDLIILEGWCLAATPVADEQLLTPLNLLEATQDPDGRWRRYVNDCLASDYQTLFTMIDCLVMLKAPAFENVYQWRLEQENKLAKKLQSQDNNRGETCHSGLMSAGSIADFIQFFQRLTEQMLIDVPERADHCYYLDPQRQIVHEHHRENHASAGDPDIH